MAPVAFAANYFGSGSLPAARSQARQRYQLAIDRHGFHFSARYDEARGRSDILTGFLHQESAEVNLVRIA